MRGQGNFTILDHHQCIIKLHYHTLFQTKIAHFRITVFLFCSFVFFACTLLIVYGNRPLEEVNNENLLRFKEENSLSYGHT